MLKKKRLHCSIEIVMNVWIGYGYHLTDSSMCSFVVRRAWDVFVS